jgi:ABC-type lipoprotein release transport system permease subunit
VTALRRTRVALFLAVRSLARGNASITLMSVAMLTAIFISVMFLPSLIAGATDGLNKQVVGTLTGDLSITPTTGTAIRDGSAYLAQIRGTAGVQAATGMRRVGNEVSHGAESVAVGVDAVDPASYAAVFTTPQHMIEGTFLTPGDKDGIVLGIGVAGADQTRQRTYGSSLKTVHTGDKVDVTLAGGQSHTFVVRGVYENNFPLSDQGAFITLDAADSLVSDTDISEQLRTTFDALDKLTSTLHTAAATSATLASGADGVSSASGTLASSAATLGSSAATVDSGADKLASSAAAVAASASSLAKAGQSLVDGLHTASTTLGKPAVADATASATAAATAAQDAAVLVATCPPTTPSYCVAVGHHATLSKDAATSAASSAKATATLAGAVTKAAASATSLASGLSQLATATSSLSNAAASLAQGTAGVASGAARLASAATDVHSSAQKVASGADSLAAALAKGAEVNGPTKADRDATLAKLDALGTPPGRDSFTRIVVTTAPGADDAQVQAELAALRSDVQLQTPAQLAAAIQDQLDTFELIDRIMRVMSLLVAAITVIIITYVDLANRRRQIGIERAIGIRSAAIVGSYVIKSIVTAVVGTVVGYLLFRFVLVPVVDQHPFQFPSGPVTLLIVPQVTRSNAVILIVVAAVAALIPAVRTVRMRILDAIWG